MVILSAGRDARLDYDTVQQWGEGVWHIALQRTVLDANAKLRFMGVTLGARLQKVWWEVMLDGIGSEADVLGICFGDGTQHFDHQSLQAHRRPRDAEQPAPQGCGSRPCPVGVRRDDRRRARQRCTPTATSPTATSC